MRRSILYCCFIAFSFLLFAAPAGATLIYDEDVDMNGTGFGNVLSVLALQETGVAGTATDIEQGKVGWDGTSDVYSELTSPDTINYGINKTATRAIGEFDTVQGSGSQPWPGLDWQDASEVRLIVNMSEQGGEDGLYFRVTDLEMTIYAPSDGAVLWESGDFPTFVPEWFGQGTGSSGIAFKLDADQVLALNAAVAGVGGWDAIGDYRLGVFSSFDYVDDGQDNIFAAKGPGASVPEPATLLLLGTALIGLAGLGRNKFFKKQG